MSIQIGNNTKLNNIRGVTKILQISDSEKSSLSSVVFPKDIIIKDSAGIVYLTDGVTPISQLSSLKLVPTKASELTQDTHMTITAGTNTTSTVSPAHGGTFTCIDSVTKDSNGHVTAVNTKTVTLPSDNNTDTLVTQNVSTANENHPILLTVTKDAVNNQGAKTSIFASGVKVNPSTNTVTASTFNGNLTGNVTGNVSGSSGSCTGNAATATNATNNANGKELTNSIIKGLSVSGKTITYTQIDGSTGTITTQDTDTLVTQNVSTANENHPILLTETKDASANQGAKTSIFASGVKVNPSTGTVTATTFSGSLSGNASSATEFSANTTVSLTGDATGTSSGSKKGWSVPVTLANSGVTAGTYGPSDDVTGNNNATISVPEITVDSKGRVTSVTNRTLTCKNNTYNVYNKTLTIQKNGTNVATFTSNSNTDVTANITVPTKTSDLTNDSHSTITMGTDSTSAESPAHGGTFTVIDGVTKDTNGHVTAVNVKTVTLPADNNTDTKVTQAYSTGNSNYPVLMTSTAGISSTSSRGATTAIVNNGIYANPSTGSIYATKVYSGNKEVLTSHQDLSGKSDVGHTHTVSDVTDFPTLATVATSGSYTDLINKPSSFTPSSHTHGNITNDGKVGTAANKPLITTSNGVVTTGSFGTAANTFCQGNDSRLSDARTPTAHNHAASDITSGTLDTARIPNLDASKITSGTIDIARLPAGALERLVTVADQTARYALTTSSVQLGDTVKQLDTGVMYYVVDTSKLNSVDGYSEYTAGSATSVPWSGVTGKPSSFTPSSHAHGNITSAGAIGSTANKPLITTTNGVVTTGSFGTTANTFCQGNDSRLSDARTPTAHTHSASDITSGLATVATSGDYADLTNKPTIPTVNNATLTIQKNGTTVKTFTANASSNVTANITVPTKTSELTNDSHSTITMGTDTTSTQSATHGGTFTCIDGVTKDTNGHITAVNVKTVTLPSDNNTDTLVTQNVSTANENHPVLLSVTKDATTNQGAKTSIFASGVKVNPSTNTVTATTFSGALSGNASSATQFSANKDVTLTGDVTGTASSKAGWSVATTLANSGVTAGTYGPSADVTGNNNATISVPEITVDSKGRVTSIANKTLTCKNNTYNVYNKTLTIQKNGTNVATFTSNSNTDVTANITVPTKTSEIDNDSGYITASDLPTNHVTTNTNQTITSTKYFQDVDVYLKQTGITLGTTPSSNQYRRVQSVDNSGTAFAQLVYVQRNDGNTYIELRAGDKFTSGAKATDGTQVWSDFQVGTSSIGDKYIYTDARWSCALVPYTNGALSLGDATHRWTNIYGTIRLDPAAGATADLLYSQMAANDYFRLQVGGTSNNGYVEIATADDGNEPIYVRQYKGVFTTLQRTLTLLDGSGNTTLPGTLNAVSYQLNGTAFGDIVTHNASEFLTSHQSLSNYSTLANTVKSLSISGKTITVTPGSGSAYTLTTQDTVYTHPTTAGNKHIPSGGSSGQFLGWDSDGTAKWVSNPNSDTKVTNTLGTTTKAYITGTTSATTNTGTQIFDTGVYLSTTAGELVATKFTGNLTGNVTGNVSGSSGSCTGNSATATNATNNANGKELSNSIIKGLSISGKTITYTQIDGSTGTLTTQDTNTDTLMTQNVSTTNATYPVLLCPTADATANQGAKTGIFASGVKVNPSTGAISNSLVTSTWLNGNNGIALLNSTAAAGQYVALIKSNSTNGHFTLANYGTKFDLNYTVGTETSNKTTKTATLLDESGNTSLPGTLNAVGYKLNGTAFGNIVTHNASEFLTSHQSLANYVTLNGDQNISGIKDFLTYTRRRDSNYTLGATPSSNLYMQHYFVDKNDIEAGWVGRVAYTNGYDTTTLSCANRFTNGAKATDGTTVSCMFEVGLTPTGAKYLNTNGAWFCDFIPITTNSKNIGSSSVIWGNIYANTLKGTLSNNGDIISYTTANALYYYSGQPAIANCAEGSSNDFTKFSYPSGDATVTSSSTANIQCLRFVWGNTYWHEMFCSPNSNYLWHRNVSNGTARGWRRVVEENVSGLTDQTWNINISGSSGSCTGNAANVTGTVAIANGGTGATTRLNAVKALTNENVGTGTNYFLTITTNWGKAGYCSVADAKTVLGLGTATFENNTGRDANNVTYNGINYYTSNGPATSLGASTTDGALYSQAYSDKWVGQIAQDYRNGNLFTRGKNNGTWQAWKAVAYHGDNVSKFTNDAGYLTAHQSLANYSTLANTVKSLSISGKTITVTPGSGSAYTLTTQDTVYTHPTTAGNKHIPSGGSANQYLKYSASGTAAWATIKTSELTNDSGFLTAHQSLSNYSTLANTVKSLSISGKTITVTPGSGSAYTLTTQDTVYTHPTTAGNKHIPSGGSSGQFLGWDSDGTAKWVNNPNTNTDTLMTQNVSTTNATYPILLCATADATANQGAKTGIFASGVKVNPSTSTVTATTFSGALSGNASTATQFSANKSVTLTGDVTGTASSKAGWSVATTLADSGVTAGTYGPSADVTGSNNATILVPEITVDAKGRVTSVTNRTYTSVNSTYNVYNKTLTIQKNGTNVATFTSNSNSNVTANITVPTKTSELTNDSGFLTSHQSLSNYVTLNSAQTISAEKTISTNLCFSSANTRGTAPSSKETRWFAEYKDSAGTRIAGIANILSTDLSNSTCMYAYNTTAATGSSIGEMGIGCDASGNVYTKAPTPATADNSTKIATTAFVKAQGYLTSHQSLSNYSTLANTVKSLSISGKTITVTPGSGSAYTLTTQDTVYTHPTTSGNKHIPSGGSSGQFLGWDSDGTAKWVNNPNTNTDTLMTQNVSTANATYPVLLVATADATANQGAKTGIFAKSVKVNPSTNVISASGFSGPLTGNVTGNCSGSSGSCTGNAATATTAGNVTGIVAIANGGTGATERLGSSGAIKNLFGESVSSPKYFLGITASYAAAGYVSMANAKTALGLSTTSDVTHNSLTVTNSSSAGIKLGSYVIYVG